MYLIKKDYYLFSNFLCFNGGMNPLESWVFSLSSWLRFTWESWEGEMCWQQWQLMSSNYIEPLIVDPKTEKKFVKNVNNFCSNYL